MPDAPTTENVADQVVVTWTEPSSDNGSPITGYEVHFNHHFDHEWTSSSMCDRSRVPVGRNQDGRDIHSNTLRAAPYSLSWGTSVYATVAATNMYGDSA
jgi:hypothetical protein